MYLTFDSAPALIPSGKQHLKELKTPSTLMEITPLHRHENSAASRTIAK
jgi:hypothetical protein